jgi:DNA primase
LGLYREAYNKGEKPDGKSLQYHGDEEIRQLVVGLSLSPHELSLRWDEIMENMQILNKDVSHADALVSLNYFKLRKLKKMFALNQEEMAQANFDKQIELIQVHNHLKELEREITQSFGTVILP